MNCNNRGRTAREYRLRIHTGDDEREESEVVLCEGCATEFLALDWIERRAVKSPDC